MLFCPALFRYKLKKQFLNLFFNVVQIQLFPFPPTTPSCSTHPYLPPWTPPAFGLVHGSLHIFLDDLSTVSSFYPLPSPLWLLLVCSLFQCLQLYCVVCFVNYVQIIGEIIWYLGVELLNVLIFVCKMITTIKLLNPSPNRVIIPVRALKAYPLSK